MDKEVLARYLVDGLSLAEIGARLKRHPSTVGYWVQKHGLVANGRDAYRPRGGLTRDELEELVKRGATLREIADELLVSVATVRYWLERFGLQTRRRRRREPEAEAARVAGLRHVELECPRHGKVEFFLRSNGSWRCSRCNQDGVVRWRQRKKLRLVREAGGRCQLCGYDRYLGALHFHHLDPSSKQFALSHSGTGRSLAEARAEAEKCALLCANCHAEVEGGIASLS